MITINLSEEQQGNLLVFLRRVDLKGAESLVHAVLVQLISAAKSSPEAVPSEPEPPESPA